MPVPWYPQTGFQALNQVRFETAVAVHGDVQVSQECLIRKRQFGFARAPSDVETDQFVQGRRDTEKGDDVSVIAEKINVVREGKDETAGAETCGERGSTVAVLYSWQYCTRTRTRNRSQLYSTVRVAIIAIYVNERGLLWIAVI